MDWTLLQKHRKFVFLDSNYPLVNNIYAILGMNHYYGLDIIFNCF